MSDSEDEDLKKAIALSLQVNSPAKPTVIDLISDDEEDDDLDAPLHIIEQRSPRATVGLGSSKLGRTRGSLGKRKVDQSTDCVDRANADYTKDCHANNNIDKTTLGHVNDINQTTDSQASANADQKLSATTLVKEIQERKKVFHPSKIEPQPEPDTSKPQSSSITSMLGMNRAQMEAERLARLQQKKQREEEALSGLNGSAELNDSRKRKASTFGSVSGSQDSRQVKTKYSTPWTRAEEETAAPMSEVPSQLSTGDPGRDAPLTQDSWPSTQREPTSVKYASLSSKASSQRPAPNVLSFNQQQALQGSGIRYPDGVVKRTWVQGCPMEDDMIKIEEVFQKDTLDLALLCTFQVDPDWVSTKLLDKAKVIWVLSARGEAEKQNLRNGAPDNYRFCFPNIEGNVNMMHAKLQLLSHPTHLRVVVPSANLVPYDWGESGVMENICFLIDLPRRAEGKLVDPGDTSLFGKELVHFLRAMGLDSKVIKSLNRFDFSRTAHIGFVHTVGGSHSGEDWKRTGYPGLGTTVRNLGLATDEVLNIDIVVRDEGWTEYGWRQDKLSSRDRDGTDATADARRKVSDIIRDRFRIYFPSKDTVAQSRGGLDAAGTICFQPKYYESNTFPKHFMRDGKSTRNVLMHNKMIFVRPEHPHKEGKDWAGWAYLGSHNFSESAWGRLVKDKTTKEPKLNCRNWECGVIFPVPVSAYAGQSGETKHIEEHTQGPLNLDIFRGYVPVPMVIPAERYGTKRPWFFQGDKE